MAEIDNQAVKSYRQQLRDRMAGMYPDRNFDGVTGENGEGGAEYLDQAILETLDGLTSSRDEYNAKSKALADLFYSDPLSAEFMQKWMETGDPRAALVETFGDDLSGLATEEGRGQFSNELKSWRDRKAENDSLSAEADANWTKTLEDLEAWGNQNGLSTEQKVSVVTKLFDITAGGLMKKFSPEDFEAAWKVMNYDTNISNARQEGEVAGRNARIEENRRRRQAAGAMPPTLNGQGTPAAESRPTEPASIWSGIK